MKIIKRLLDTIEKRAIKKNNWIEISNTKHHYFYIDVMTYKGKELSLADGTIIRHGDKVGELHLNNNNMPEVSNIRSLKLFSRALDDEIVSLSRELHKDEFCQLKAFFGRTILFNILRKKGFEIIDIRNKRLKWFLIFWDSLIKKVYSKSSNNSRKIRKPKEVWITRETLLRKLGDIHEKENH